MHGYSEDFRRLVTRERFQQLRHEAQVDRLARENRATVPERLPRRSMIWLAPGASRRATQPRLEA